MIPVQEDAQENQTMAVSLQEILASLDPAMRRDVEKRAAEIVAEHDKAVARRARAAERRARTREQRDRR